MFSLKKFFGFTLGIPLFFATSCTDFYNRSYQWGEEAPIKPFSVKLENVSSRFESGTTWLETSVHIMNKSNTPAAFDLSKIKLRVGNAKIISPQDPVSEKINFVKNQELLISKKFKLSPEELTQPLALIVGSEKMDHHEVLTLFHLPDQRK